MNQETMQRISALAKTTSFADVFKMAFSDQALTQQEMGPEMRALVESIIGVSSPKDEDPDGTPNAQGAAVQGAPPNGFQRQACRCPIEARWGPLRKIHLSDAVVTSGLQNHAELEPDRHSLASISEPLQKALAAEPSSTDHQQRYWIQLGWAGLYDCDLDHVKTVVDVVCPRGRRPAALPVYMDLRNNRFYLNTDAAVASLCTLLEDDRVAVVDLRFNPCTSILERARRMCAALTPAHCAKLVWDATFETSRTSDAFWLKAVNGRRDELAGNVVEAHLWLHSHANA